MIAKNIFLLLFLSIFSVNAQSKANEILGNWISTDQSVAVQVYHANNDYRAKVLWFDDRIGSGVPMNQRLDSANPDAVLRKRKIIGMEILNGLEYDPTTHTWENGKIYDGSSGRTWDSAAAFTKDGLLKVRGYWKFKWIGKSMTFKRMK